MLKVHGRRCASLSPKVAFNHGQQLVFASTEMTMVLPVKSSIFVNTSGWPIITSGFFRKAAATVTAMMPCSRAFRVCTS